jgi:hypothetical protein
MKTCLFAPCYLDGLDPAKSERLDRVKRWINYHWAIRDKLGFDRIFLSDDCSDWVKVASLGGTILNEKLEVIQRQDDFLTVVRYEPHLSGGGQWNYSYCWKALYVMRDLMKKYGYEKAITIDTDGFVLTERLASYVRGLDEGWTAFWVRTYSFPTAEFHVLCPSGMYQFEEFLIPHYMAHQGKYMEMALPFTRVERGFNCDRWGEGRHPQKPDMDFYSQAPVNIPLTFNMEGR